MYSILHFHFESAFRALAYSRPDCIPRVRSICASRLYQKTTPPARLTMLWQEVLRLSDHRDMFTEVTFREIVRRLVDDMIEYDVEHIDLRIGPSVGRWQWMRSLTDGLDVFSEELSSHSGLTIAFLAGINLRKSEGELDSIFSTLCNDNAVTSRIAGLDLNFFPSDLPKIERYLDQIRALQADGLKINLHLGELFDNKVSRHVLSRIVPDRIGHGVLLLCDKELVALIRDHEICLDMCPTSNTLLGVVDWRQESPANQALQLGIPVSINTDDPLLFDTNISNEMRLSGLTGEQIDVVIDTSRKYRYAAS